MKKNKLVMIVSILLVILILMGFLVSLVAYGDGMELNQVEKSEMDRMLSSKIPMNIDHQKYLYNLCKTRNLDYVKVLAIVQTESSFRPNVVSAGNYGYMQLNKVNHRRLIASLGTKNAPLNPYVNLNWGTKMLEELYRKFEARGYSGDRLDRAVWSSYNKGEGGYRRSGEAKNYINKTNKHIKYIKNTLGI